MPNTIKLMQKISIMLRLIKNEEQYEEALEQIYVLMQKEILPDSAEEANLEILTLLVKEYEKEKERIKNRGYEGSITMFLQPYVTVCDTLVIKSDKYPERNGKYLCTSVSGEFGTSGGRVKANVGIYLGGI